MDGAGEEGAVSDEAGVELGEEGVVDYSDCGGFFVDEAEGDAGEGEAVYEVGRAVYVVVCT